MKHNVILGIIAIIASCTIGYAYAHALLTDAASSTTNTFTAAAEFPQPTEVETSITPTPTPSPTPGGVNPGDVLINEVSSNGDFSEDWVELVNKTNSEIDISGWKIFDNNGSDTIPDESTIPANGYAIVVGSTNTLTVLPPAVHIELSTSTIGGTGGLADGGDSLLLEKGDGTDIDSVSYGSDTAVFTLPSITAGNTLRRVPDGVDANTAGDWQVGVPSLGIAN